ncbi:MAG: T9SS type A sorting domain-containing protein [Flavobacteriaceae bacterium]|nr:T9SS type A sorting domain-containing protein [Flavobacteriaceae bacterium]
MKKPLLLLILAISTTIVFSQSETQNEDNYKRIKINNPTEETIHKLQEIGVDLRCGVVINEDKIQLELSQLELNQLNNKGIIYDIEIEDVSKFYQDRIEATYDKALKDLEIEKAKAVAQKASISSTSLDNFLEYTGCDEINWATPINFNLGSMGGCLTVSETLAELDQMRFLYPSLISAKTDVSSTSQTTWGNPSSTITNNGLTYSGQGTTRWNPQTVYYVRITGDQASAEGTKPQSLYTSMIHAREVGSLMSNIYFMWYLLENYATDPAIQHLVDNNELYFIPIVNPDGLRWNEHLNSSGGGMQRKNCRPNTGSTSNSTTTRGVDLNRNFDYFWGGAGSGSSGTPSSDSYRGPLVESEPETQILSSFVLARSFETCLMNHTSANSIPHPYGGNPTFVSGREDEMHKWHEDMTRYNRYVSGATIFPAANGIADDWMVGGTADANGSIGSGQNILASTPEHGSTGFWPPTSDIVPIAKRAMRLSLTTAYYGGKYAKFHDLTQSDITALSSNLTFGIERLGQTASDFTLTVTPVSANIVSITSPTTQSGMTILEQRDVTAALTLDVGISANDKIEYRVQLANGDGVIFYDANFEKYYQPTVLFSHNPDIDGLTGWTQSGGWNNSSADAYSGSDALRTGDAVPYANNNTKTLTTTSSYDFSSSTEVLVQFYTKWDLERNFDFVELLGSTDGSTWQSLCGKYNKPNSTNSTNNSHGAKNGTSYSFQSNNSSGKVYDGDRMDKWVMEEVAINASDNSFLFNAPTAQFRFRFRSDANNRSENYSTTSEGFFIDDFKIISIQIACDDTNPPTSVAVSGITTATANVTWDAIPSATYDLRYREIGAPSWTTITDIATNNYTITGLTDSTNHEVQVNTRCTSTTSAFSSSVNFTTSIPVPCTGSVVNAFPYAESFESGLGLWSQDASEDIDWVRNSGTTPSPSTGPSAASDGTWYMYTEASVANNGSPNKTAYLISPCIEFDGFENAQITFDYHMFGSSIGTLSLEASTDDGANYSTVFSISGEQHGSNGAAWTNEVVDLSVYDGQTIKLRFHGLTSTSWQGDMAFDNINITADTAVLSVSDFDINEWAIYPNPSSIGMINIKAPNDIQKFDVLISNTLGQQVYQEKVVTSNNTHIINTENLNTGVYFITLKTNEGKSTKKIIIQ